MEFKIPFTITSLPRLIAKASLFKRFVKKKENPKLEEYLKRSDIEITREEYLSICIQGFLVFFLIFFAVVSTFMVILELEKQFLFSFIVAFLSGAFICFSRMTYPRIYDVRRQKDIER